MYACGYRNGFLEDAQRSNWQESGFRPLVWSAWYPVATDVKNRTMQRTTLGMFEVGSLHVGLPPSTERRWPVVLLSHGTGGSPESLGWLAHGLAIQGHVVLACQHHGNTAAEPYMAEGFLSWWERARDLSRLLTLWSEQPEWRGVLALDQVLAVGYSLGSHTVLALAGAITSMMQMEQWMQTSGSSVRGPREFPNVADDIAMLLQSSKVFRDSWERQSDDYCDARVRAIVALAPPPPIRAFTTKSLRGISLPVQVVVGGADEEAPTSVGAKWLAEVIPTMKVHDLGAEVGHHTFLGLPSATGRATCPALFVDPQGANRELVHKRVLEIALSSLVGL